MPTNFKVTGHVIAALELRSGTGTKGEWQAQEFLVGYDISETHPKKIVIQAFGEDKIKQIADLKTYEVADFHYNTSAKEYNGKFYGQNDLWKVVRRGDVSNKPVSSGDDESQDLPF